MTQLSRNELNAEVAQAVLLRKALDHIVDSAVLQDEQAGGLANVVEDTSPQLGGNLDTNGKNIDSISPTELNYLNGATSNIQTQLDAKATSANLTSHTSNTSNPHSVTKSQVGLGNVRNVDTTKSNYSAFGPGSTEDIDAGYSVGSIWVHHNLGTYYGYVCTDATANAAQWSMFSVFVI